ncbi:hypothetical protein BSL78_13986 [Apostichopus japonicus]|uniref:Integrase catalytic domain-containing protein n=1 Tax=Stichopus japonicus TaxID=307972 RepID=A0A2G8KMB1_STIJA|nr:hypothetical protein BSL78_13986 [Apostichopus japonicus]
MEVDTGAGVTLIPKETFFKKLKSKVKLHATKVVLKTYLGDKIPVHGKVKEQVTEEINRLVKEGILEKVEYSEWAAPVVPVKKPDGKIRLCGDYKVTINPELETTEYPLPRPEELYAKLNGGQKFSKLDLTSAYQQNLDKSRAKLFTAGKRSSRNSFWCPAFPPILCGKRFILETDHKPLTYILGPKRGIPVLAASRLQRWAILLAGYEYDIKYRTTKQNANADCLSRLPQQTQNKSGESNDQFTVLWTDEGSKVNEVQVNSLPVSSEKLRKETDKDKVLSRVKYFILNGWPNETVNVKFQPYYRKRNELTVECGCILWGVRVVVPESLQQYVLKELHEGHPGMVRMKSLARGHVYWPRLDQQLEELVGSCDDCRQYQTLPPKAPVNPWRWPTEPWQRIHVDFAGPFLGSMFLLVVDSHSKWPEVIPMKTTTAEKNNSYAKMFSKYGLPHTVVSDNGPQFVAHEFKEFLKKNNVEHIKSAVKHPASNGEVERFVQTFKQSMKKSQNDSGNLHQKLDRFLLSYRVTPHSVTKETPSKLFLKRELRTRLSSLKPSLSTKLSKGQSHEVMEGSVRQFSVGDSV